MSDPVEEPTEEVTQEVETPEGGESGGNPAWNDLRSKLDLVSFKAIEPDLQKWDAEAQKRIESLNKQYGWAADLSKNGVTPEQIQKALTVAQRIDEDPAAIYTALGTFLEENGRLPNKAELKQEVADQQNEDPADEAEKPAEDPRFQTLMQQNERLTAMFEQQEQARAQQAADDALAAEVDKLKQAHPEFEDSDVREVLNRAFLAAQMAAQQGKEVPDSLETYAKDYIDNVRNRILQNPRAGDLAPKLIPTSGGTPAASNAQTTLGHMSRGQTQDLVAELLAKGAQ